MNEDEEWRKVAFWARLGTVVVGLVAVVVTVLLIFLTIKFA